MARKMSPKPNARALATGALLHELLVNDPRYRRTWLMRARRVRGGELSRAAVAEVIASHLWEVGERPDTNIDLPRELKDRVGRALDGVILTSETLRWILDAFGFTAEDARRVWMTYSGIQTGSSGVGHTLIRQRPMARPQWHRTVSLFERYRMAADGSLLDRRTWHTIVAREDGVSEYLFNHEPYAEKVRVVHGGIAGGRYLYGDGLVGQGIVLDRTLRKGETTSMEYVTEYPEGRVYVSEVRRPARSRSENIDIAIEFHPRRVPNAVFWCVWSDHLDGASVSEEPVELRDSVVRRFVPFIEQTVVGFRWLW